MKLMTLMYTGLKCAQHMALLGVVDGHGQSKDTIFSVHGLYQTFRSKDFLISFCSTCHSLSRLDVEI